MHIIIAIITAIAGLLWALNALQRSGFDLNSLNPFFWARRRRWENMQVNPLYGVETARELAALLMFAVMRQGGDPTEEQKQHLLGLYREELRFAENDSTEMYTVASHLLSTDPNYMHKVQDLMAPALPSMTVEQKQSVPQLVRTVAEFNGPPNKTQQDFVSAIEETLARSSR